MTSIDPHRLSAARCEVQKDLSAFRRARGAESFQAFCNIYLPHHFRDEHSPMHSELFEMLQRAGVNRGARIAVAAPRGHAKSTIVSCAYVLWRLCTPIPTEATTSTDPGEPYILLISTTQDQASDFLSFVKRELTGNERLGEDFPELAEPGDAPAPRWRKDEIITRTGVKITALGSDTKIRGRRNQQHRPSLIILDDVEAEPEVRSPDQREKKLAWFNRVVMKAGGPITNVLVVGTVLHYDSLLSRLLDPARSPGWTTRKYRAVRKWSQRPELWSQWESIFCTLQEFEGRAGPEAAKAFLDANREAMLEGTDALWPAREPYEKLMELRLREGRASFDAEKQNEPVNPADCCFQESDFVFWDRAPGSPIYAAGGKSVQTYESEEELLASLGAHIEIFGACDPSMGKAGRNRDDSAIITIARDTVSGVMYVLDADIRRRRPDAIIDDVIAYDRRRKYSRFGFEVNQFQEFLAEELRRCSRIAGAQVPVQDVHHSSDKLGRIQRLQPLITSGTLRFSRRQAVLLDQLRQFPAAAHDDGPDALEMAVSLADGPATEVFVVVPNSASDGWDDDDVAWNPIRSAEDFCQRRW